MVDGSFLPLLVEQDSDIEEIDDKGLLQNGCISPHNIEKDKQLAQKRNYTILHSHQDDSGTSRNLSEESDEKRKPLSDRTLAGKLDGVGPANEKACVHSEEASEWISTREHTRKLNEYYGSSNTDVKRQKKHSSGTHHCESSSSPIGNSELLCLGSPGKPSNVRSVRPQHSHAASSVNQIIDIGDFSPERRNNGSHNIDCSRSSESDVSVIELEEDEDEDEDEEQEYDSNVAADDWIDEQIALEYQRSFQHTSPSGSHYESHPSMHTLEALDSLNNIGMTSGSLQFWHDFDDFDDDFDENDYGTLWALDDNNHQHAGASAAQINGLPESTVQTDNLDECSVCLEIPSIGDTMRHLPCLHRFHKDCIDEWLRRRASCPLCKSSIT